MNYQSFFGMHVLLSDEALEFLRASAYLFSAILSFVLTLYFLRCLLRFT